MKKIFFICLSFFTFFGAFSQQKSLKGKFVSRIEDVEGDSTYLLLSNGKLHKLGFGEDNETFDSARAGDSVVSRGGCGSNYIGSARKSAKTTSISKSLFKTYHSFDNLLSMLRPDDIVEPLIKSEQNWDKRTKYERIGAKFPKIYLFAFKKEANDNDYHLIVGDDPDHAKATLFNSEISGIPASGQQDIVKARNDFVAAMNLDDTKCMSKYVVFLDPPVEISIEGPVFFDTEHAAGAIGPTYQGVKLKPKTSWEIHPITKFKRL